MACHVVACHGMGWRDGLGVHGMGWRDGLGVHGRGGDDREMPVINLLFGLGAVLLCIPALSGIDTAADVRHYAAGTNPPPSPPFLSCHAGVLASDASSILQPYFQSDRDRKSQPPKRLRRQEEKDGSVRVVGDRRSLFTTAMLPSVLPQQVMQRSQTVLRSIHSS